MIYKILSFSLALAAYSCSNNFLHQDQKTITPIADTIFMTDLVSEMRVQFNFSQGGNGRWRIQQFPAWMEVTPLEGKFVGNNSSFTLRIPDKSLIAQWGAYDLPLVFEVEGSGLVKYPFLFMNFGSPHITLSNNNLLLDYGSMGNFAIRDIENGILIWEIKDKPSWLTLSSQNGILKPGEENNIIVTTNRDKLSYGDYSGVITLAVNSYEKELKVQVSMKVGDPTMTGSLTKIEGEIVDADYSKSSGLMVVAAQYPNRIYFIKPGEQMTSLDLDKVPLNISISEGGDQVGATFTNTDLSLISPVNRTLTKNIHTGIIASDMSLGNNGWAYLAPKQYDSDYLTSVDLNTGQILKNNTNLSGLSLIKKVPGKNLLYGSKIGYSPEFLIVLDISNGAANENIDQWYSTNLWKFWFSEDGEQLFTGFRKIYKSPAYLQQGNIFESPALLGELGEIPGSITAIDHSSVLGEVFVGYKSITNEIGTKIVRIDDKGYTHKSVFTINDCIVNENGNVLSLAPDVPYMFIKKDGKELYVIKKGMSNSGKNYWFYEKINLAN